VSENPAPENLPAFGIFILLRNAVLLSFALVPQPDFSPRSCTAAAREVADHSVSNSYDITQNKRSFISHKCCKKA